MIAYSEIRALNWSSLRHLVVSPLLYKHRVDHPEPYKQVFALGGAAHCLILEPGRFDSRYAVYDAVRNGAKWEAWQAEHPGIQSLKQHELDTAQEVAAAVRGNRDAATLLTGGLYEEPIEWLAPNGLKCKGRLDYLRPRMVVDLKTARDIGDRPFPRDAANHLYHAQLTWYHDGAIAGGRLPADADPPHLIVVEKDPPYDCGVYWLTDEDMAKGRALYRDLLRKFDECTAADWWPGKLPQPKPLDVPDWAPGANIIPEEDL